MSYNERGVNVVIDYKTVAELQRLFLDMSSCRGKPAQLEATQRTQAHVSEILTATVMKQIGGMKLIR